MVLARTASNKANTSIMDFKCDYIWHVMFAEWVYSQIHTGGGAHFAPIH